MAKPSETPETPTCKNCGQPVAKHYLPDGSWNNAQDCFEVNTQRKTVNVPSDR